MKYPFERSHYRVQYPLSERPVFEFEGRRLPVVDCSERGLRFVRPPGLALEAGQVIAGVVRFRRGAEAEVEGRVVRLDARQSAVHLDTAGIPLGIILDEQRYLRSRYPHGF